MVSMHLSSECFVFESVWRPVIPAEILRGVPSYFLSHHFLLLTFDSIQCAS